MTNRSNKGVRLETDIEKCREESNWRKVIELSEQLKAKHNNQVPLYSFLLGEGKLELFLEECPPIESNINRAKSGLQEAKRCLEGATCEQGDKAGVALDSHLLLGKLHYAMGLYEEALGHFSDADLQGLTERSLPSRSLRIIAESFAVKGLCLEKVPPSSTSKYKQAEWEEQMMRCFELAGDLALLYLQELDKLIQPTPSLTGTIDRAGGGIVMQSSTRTESNSMGPILETALQRSPFLHLNARRLPQAVNRYRKMLSALESSGTHSLRLNLTRQLAEVLIRGFTGSNYTAPTPNGNKKSGGAWKPQLYTGPNMFVPRSENEELVLLLLISEAMAVREAVLSQSPEFKEARVKALSNAIAVYDLLAVVLVRWGQVSLLNECLEHALKFSFEEAQVWMQRALCLDSMGLHVQALAVLRQVTRMLPTKVLPCLMAARICYQHLNSLEEGIEWSEKGLQRELAHPQGLLSRCHLYIAIGSYYAGLLTHLKTSKQAFVQACTDHLIKAQGMDPSDHLIEYYTGLSVGSRGQVSEALAHAKAALTLCPEHAPSLHLTVLLLTAQKQFPEAHALLKTAIADFPDSIDLHYVKAHLDLHTYGPEAALVTAKNMLVLWKCQYEEQTLIDQSDNKSVFQLYTCEMSDKDSNSVHGASAAASRVEQALSEVASSLSGFTPRPGPHHAWLLQLHIWLLLAEIYLSMDQVDQAAASIQEATNIYPMSHHIMFTRGLVHEHKKEFTEAKQCFQNAVSINPFHIKSLQHLGLMYLYLGNQRMAEKTLRDAARIDPHSPQTWYNLGKVLDSLGDHQRASDCMSTALQVETLSPILPYNTIPITFN